MKNFPGLCINLIALAAIAPFRIVAATTTESTVKQAASDTEKTLGVSAGIGATDAGDHLDVICGGIAPVQYGGTVAFGDFLTADASGRAIVAAAGDRIIGVAHEAGAVDEIGSVHIAPSFYPA